MELPKETKAGRMKFYIENALLDLLGFIFFNPNFVVNFCHPADERNVSTSSSIQVQKHGDNASRSSSSSSSSSDSGSSSSGTALISDSI